MLSIQGQIFCHNQVLCTSALSPGTLTEVSSMLCVWTPLLTSYLHSSAARLCC